MLMITDDDIQLLAEIRCEYNCFDALEKPYYDVMKKAMKAFRILQNIPDEHGDLIDRDKLKNNLLSEHAYYYNRTDAAIAVQACIADVETSKAVIKAERKDDADN